MSDFVIIANAEGSQRRVSKRSYELLSPGQRKQWRIVGEAKGPAKAEAGAGMTTSASFLPPEIEEAQRAKAHAAEEAVASAMVSGEPVAPDHPVAAEEAPQPEAPGAPAAPVAAPETAEEPLAPALQAEQGPNDDIASLPNMGAKCAEVLAAAGIDTFAKLANAPASEINKALEAGNFAAKKAQVPGWKTKAAERLQSAKR